MTPRPQMTMPFTGHIEFHHVHYLGSRVPNYRFQGCHKWIASLCDVPIWSFWEGLWALRFVPWDEDRDRMATFRNSASNVTP